MKSISWLHFHPLFKRYHLGLFLCLLVHLWRRSQRPCNRHRILNHRLPLRRRYKYTFLLHGLRWNKTLFALESSVVLYKYVCIISKRYGWHVHQTILLVVEIAGIVLIIPTLTPPFIPLPQWRFSIMHQPFRRCVISLSGLDVSIRLAKSHII